MVQKIKKKILKFNKNEKPHKKYQVLIMYYITKARKMLYVNAKQRFTCQYDVTVITFDALNIQQYPKKKDYEQMLYIAMPNFYHRE